MRMQRFESRESASRAAADAIEHALHDALAVQESAMFAVSGGSTPVACLRELAERELDWSRVTVLLTDERCVPADHEDSNERMVRATLLQGPAAAADFLRITPGTPMCAGDLACVLLGMGSDGHFASLFPDLRELGAHLRTSAPGAAEVVEVRTAASPHARVSLTLARLLKTRSLMLLAFGDDKRAVLEAPDELPVAALLQQEICALDVLWAP